MSVLRSVPVDDLCRRGSVRDADVQKLRRAYYGGGTITAEEADALVRINAACKVQDPSWVEFFIEAITDYVVNDAAPEGYLTTANADWLLSRVAGKGVIDSNTELELLINVIEKARWLPESLVGFALEQVKRAVVTGRGPLRAAAELDPGSITVGEVELLRRILFAFGGDGNVAITRREAEVLFEINDATAGAPSCPQWNDLFVKAIANAVMAASNYRAPSREEALRRAAWLDSRGDLAAGNFFGGMLSGGVSGILQTYRAQSEEDSALAHLERQRIAIITHEEVTEAEASWLAQRIRRDGKLTANERALLTFLKCEGAKIHPDLAALFDHLDRAA